MSKTFVEYTLNSHKDNAIKSYASLLRQFIGIMDVLDNAKTADVLPQVFKSLRDCRDKAKIRLLKHTVQLDQFTLLNDIRRGKVKLVDAETNKLLPVKFHTLDE